MIRINIILLCFWSIWFAALFFFLNNILRRRSLFSPAPLGRHRDYLVN